MGERASSSSDDVTTNSIQRAIDRAMARLAPSSSTTQPTPDLPQTSSQMHSSEVISQLDNNLPDVISEGSDGVAYHALESTVANFQQFVPQPPVRPAKRLAPATPETEEGRKRQVQFDLQDYDEESPNKVYTIPAPPSEQYLERWCMEGADDDMDFSNLDPADDEEILLAGAEFSTTDPDHEMTAYRSELNGDEVTIDVNKVDELMSGGVSADISDIIHRQGSSSWGEEDEQEPAEYKPTISESPMKRRSGARPSRRPMGGLPDHLKGLLGQANLYRARGNDQEALNLCLEIVRQAPTVAETYKTIAGIYDSRGEEDKAIQFYTIAAHLNANELFIWEKLVNHHMKRAELAEPMSLDHLDALREVSRCCSRAIRDNQSSPDEFSVQTMMRFASIRLQCAQQTGERNRIKYGMRMYLLLVKNHLDSETYSEMAHELVQYYTEDNEQLKALEILENLRVYHPRCLDLGDLNILLELFLVAKMFSKCVSVAAQMMGIVLNVDDSAPKSDDEPTIYSSFQMPGNIHLDIKIKFAIGLIQTQNHHLVQPIIEELFNQPNLIELSDMFIEVCEAYRDQALFSEEHQAWSRLVQLEGYCDFDIAWFKLGECLETLGRSSEAEDAYLRCLQLNSAHVQCRLNLAKYYQTFFISRALEILTVPHECPDEVKTDVRIVNMRIDMQETVSEMTYFKTVYEVFFYVFSTMAKYSEFSDVAVEPIEEGTDEVQLVQRRHKRLKIQSSIRSRLNVSWEKFHKAAVIGLRLGKKKDLLYMVIQAAQSHVYPERTRDLQLFAIRLGTQLKSHKVYYCAKTLLQATQFQSRQVWSLFNVVSSFIQDSRAHKYLVHLDKTQRIRNFSKSMFLAVNSLESGSYKFALAELSLHFLNQQRNPLYNFLIGLLYLHLASQKFARMKSTLLTLSIFFLKRYHLLRENPQESYYNIGRAFHQIEILPQAIYYYEKSLESPAAVSDQGTSFSVEKFAAHNLSRIYLNSGSKLLALKLLKQYPLI